MSRVRLVIRLPLGCGGSVVILGRSPRIQHLFKIGPASVIGRLEGLGRAGIGGVVGLDVCSQLRAEIIQPCLLYTSDAADE